MIKLPETLQDLNKITTLDVRNNLFKTLPAWVFTIHPSISVNFKKEYIWNAISVYGNPGIFRSEVLGSEGGYNMGN